jgi:hypothetical protein
MSGKLLPLLQWFRLAALEFFISAGLTPVTLWMRSYRMAERRHGRLAADKLFLHPLAKGSGIRKKTSRDGSGSATMRRASSSDRGPIDSTSKTMAGSRWRQIKRRFSSNEKDRSR